MCQRAACSRRVGATPKSVAQSEPRVWACSLRAGFVLALNGFRPKWWVANTCEATENEVARSYDCLHTGCSARTSPWVLDWFHWKSRLITLIPLILISIALKKQTNHTNPTNLEFQRIESILIFSFRIKINEISGISLLFEWNANRD